MKNIQPEHNRAKVLLQKFESLTIHRYTTIPLPRYRHIPGLTPHPISDIHGHSYGKRNENVQRMLETDWQSNELYLYAIDLFNYKYFWETHEALEDLWKIEDEFNTRLFLQGVIQISAAYVKWIQGIEGGVEKLSMKGLHRLRSLKDSKTIFYGINLSKFIDEHEYFLSSQDQRVSIPPSILLNLSENDTLIR